MAVTIKVRTDGPYRLDGEFTIVDAEGNPIPIPEGKGVALCRCGASSTKPFCDGTHRTIGFKGATEIRAASEP